MISCTSSFEKKNPPLVLPKNSIKRKLESDFVVSSEDRLISKCQAIIRGNLTRKRTVFVNDFKPVLDRHLISRTRNPVYREMENILLCREINAKLQDLQSHGTQFPIKKLMTSKNNQVLLPLKKMIKTKEQFIELDYKIIGVIKYINLSILVERNEEKVFISITPKYSLLGEGQFKTVNAVQTFLLERKTVNGCKKSWQSSYFTQVVITVNPLPEYYLNTVREGNFNNETCYQMMQAEQKEGKATDVYITPHIVEITSGKFFQGWFLGDLEKALKKESLPVDLNKNDGYRSFSKLDASRVIEDLYHTVKWLTHKNFNHADIKENNVFIKFEKDNRGVERFIGFLGDFDLSSFNNAKIFNLSKYYSRDCSFSKLGITTPLTDIYSFVNLLCQVTFDELQCYELQLARDIIANFKLSPEEAYQKIIVSPDFDLFKKVDVDLAKKLQELQKSQLKGKLPERGKKIAWKELKESQQQAWILLCYLVKKSKEIMGCIQQLKLNSLGTTNSPIFHCDLEEVFDKTFKVIKLFQGEIEAEEKVFLSFFS